jgi:flagellar protein FliL
MATKKPAPAAAEPAAAPAGKSKKRLIIMIVLGILLIGLSVGGTIAALKFFGGKGGEEGKKDEHSAEAKPDESAALGAVDEDGKPRPTLYLELKPEIVVSFDVGGRQRFLKATVNMMTYDPAIEAAITLHQPMIANALVMLVSKKQFERLQSVEGKEELRTEAFNEINALLEKETHKKNGITQVLFSEFVLQ